MPWDKLRSALQSSALTSSPLDTNAAFLSLTLLFNDNAQMRDDIFSPGQ